MPHIPAPLQRLRFFKHELGVDDTSLKRLAPHKRALVAASRDLAEHLFCLFSGYAQTKAVIEQVFPPEFIKKVWSNWFASLWTSPIDDAFLERQWDQGVRYANWGVDQRFVSLGHVRVRRFVSEILAGLLPPEERERILPAADGLLDLCQLTTTEAYLAGAALSGETVIQGVAHQIRNPLTVIGGNAMLLTRATAKNGRERDLSETIYAESRRLERLAGDLALYTAVRKEQATLRSVELAPLIRATLNAARKEHGPKTIDERIEIHPDHATALADPQLVRILLFECFANALEALDETDEPRLTVRTRPGPGVSRTLTLEIVNSGGLPRALASEDDLEALFTPFHSEKSHGTGLGLPLARLAARRNFGTLHLVLGEDGVHAVAVLLAPGIALDGDPDEDELSARALAAINGTDPAICPVHDRGPKAADLTAVRGLGSTATPDIAPLPDTDTDTEPTDPD